MRLFNLYYERKYCTEHEEGGRYRLIDRENLLKKLSCGSEKQFRKWYEAGIADKLRQDEIQRESFWSDSRVVGDYDFVLRQAKRKDRKNIVEAGSGLYYL